MSKYSNETKIKAIESVKAKGLSYKMAAEQVGAGKSDVEKWVRLYQEHGIEGLLIKNGTYTGQFKVSVIEYMHKHNLSIRETAVKYGIPSAATVLTWERIYYEGGAMALFKDGRGRPKMTEREKPKKLKLDKKVEEDLISENQRLRMENAYLKKLQALVAERIKRENGKK